jgi:hypothetical protein
VAVKAYDVFGVQPNDAEAREGSGDTGEIGSKVHEGARSTDHEDRLLEFSFPQQCRRQRQVAHGLIASCPYQHPAPLMGTASPMST